MRVWSTGQPQAECSCAQGCVPSGRGREGARRVAGERDADGAALKERHRGPGSRTVRTWSAPGGGWSPWGPGGPGGQGAEDPVGAPSGCGSRKSREVVFRELDKGRPSSPAAHFEDLRRAVDVARANVIGEGSAQGGGHAGGPRRRVHVWGRWSGKSCRGWFAGGRGCPFGHAVQMSRRPFRPPEPRRLLGVDFMLVVVLWGSSHVVGLGGRRVGKLKDWLSRSCRFGRLVCFRRRGGQVACGPSRRCGSRATHIGRQ